MPDKGHPPWQANLCPRFKHKSFCFLELFLHNKSSRQCYSVLSDVGVKNELCIPLESESSVLST